MKIVRFDIGDEYYGKQNQHKNMVHLQSFSKDVAYVHNILCQAHLNKMVWQKGEIEH